MQVAQGQGLVRVCALVQTAIGCCILHAANFGRALFRIMNTSHLLLYPSLTSAQDGLDLCNLRWWWCLSCHQLAQDFTRTCSGPATCLGGVFPVPTSALLMCTHELPCCHHPP